MSEQNMGSEDRLLQLLADRATQGLDESEDRVRMDLLREHEDLDDESFEMTAAALELCLLEPELEPLPPAVRNRVEKDAIAWLAELRGLSVAPADAPPPHVERPAPPRRDSSVGLGLRLLPWLAAAACLAIAVLAWIPSARLTPTQMRAGLLLEAPDLVTTSWTATEDPAAMRNGVVAEGDVMWSDARQEGYMRFRGLASNDPTVSQYQLWIFDANQPEANPVSGGVFDIDRATGEVVVPIRAEILVSQPWLFAVTVEKPGGVVVSRRERIPVLAQLGDPPA